jgi:hypothetical protein
MTARKERLTCQRPIPIVAHPTGRACARRYRTGDIGAFERVPPLPQALVEGPEPEGPASHCHSRIYVALENGGRAVAINSLTNTVVASVPIGQTTQALVYVPGAVPDGAGADNLVPLGEAANTAHFELQRGGAAPPQAQASVAVNSLGLLDLVQIAARGLAPKAQYRVYLAASDHAPFGQLEPLALLTTNPDGAGIVQAVGPLKTLASAAESPTDHPRRFLLVTESRDSSQVVLRQVVGPVTGRPH